MAPASAAMRGSTAVDDTGAIVLAGVESKHGPMKGIFARQLRIPSITLDIHALIVAQKPLDAAAGAVVVVEADVIELATDETPVVVALRFASIII